MKHVLQTLLFVAVAIACSKHHDPAIITPASCQLTSQTNTDLVVTASYSSAGLVDTIRVNYPAGPATAVVVIKYDNQGHMTDMSDSYEHKTFQTGSNGKPSLETYYLRNKAGGDSVQVSTRSFIWQSDSLVQKTVVSDYTRYEYDATGNLRKVYVHDGANEVLLYTYSAYDSEKSPFTNFPFDIDVFLGSPLLKIPTEITADYYPMQRKHNYTVYNYYSTASDSTTFHYTYTYNASGYALGDGTSTFAYVCK